MPPGVRNDGVGQSGGLCVGKKLAPCSLPPQRPFRPILPSAPGSLPPHTPVRPYTLPPHAPVRKVRKKVRKSSTAARYTLSANSRCEQMKASRLVSGSQPKGSQKATSVHRMQHRVAKHDRFVLQFTERNTGLQTTTGSSWPHLRATVRSIRQSAVSGRASSSFTSVGGNTCSRPPLPRFRPILPSAPCSLPPQPPFRVRPILPSAPCSLPPQARFRPILPFAPYSLPPQPLPPHAPFRPMLPSASGRPWMLIGGSRVRRGGAGELLGIDV
jgi:hypothetical protein